MPDQRSGWEPLWRALTSLKGRILLASLVSLIVTTACAAWVLFEQTERNLLQVRQDRQLDEVVRAARLLSRRAVDLERGLRQTAGLLDESTLSDPQRLQRFLSDRDSLLTLFGAVFIASPKGETLAFAEADGSAPARLDLGDREYFRHTVAQGRPTVSEALSSRFNGAPVVVFTQPVIRRGQVVAVLGGTFRLLQRDVLVELTDLFGNSGESLFMVTDRQGRIIAHPDRDRLLQPAAGETRLAEALAAWHDAGEPLETTGLTYSGSEFRVAVAGVPGPHWLVWQAVSERELLAPLRAARQPTLLWTGGLLLLALAGTAVFLRHQFQPLARLQTRTAQLFAPSLDPDSGWPQGQDEIGALSATLQRAAREHHRVEQARELALQRLGSVMEFAPIGLAFTRGKVFELVSPEMCRMFGRTEAELLGRPTQIIYASNEDYLALGPQVLAAFKAGQPYVGQWKMLRADGSRLWVQLRGRPIDARDPHAGTIWSLMDITDEVLARDRLEWMAHHDPLTGLANRKAFELRASRLFDARPRSIPAALLVIDLDHFKPINDQWGHAAGDEMLAAVAGAILGCVRGNDLVARYGGDEFAVLLERCSARAGQRVLEAIEQAVAQLQVQRQGQVLRVGASVGMAMLGEAQPGLADWIAEADAACYAAKAQRHRQPTSPRVQALRLVAGDGSH